MNLAAPAPKVEPATAETASKVGEATAQQATQVEAAIASAAMSVGPAVVSPSTGAAAAAAAGTSAPSSSLEDQPSSSPLSVEALRGGTGSEFESYAAVLRGAPPKNFLQRWLPCIYDERSFVTYGEVKKYILVKGSVCFVFGTETDLQPYYAIELEEVDPIQEDSTRLDPCSVTVSPLPGSNLPRPEMITILLKYKTNHKQAFQLTFDTKNDPDLAQRFYTVVKAASAAANDDKKSGAGGPKPVVSASVAKAAMIGKEAAKAQPEI